jgi:transcriptional regulator with XRE-family HTH domain
MAFCIKFGKNQMMNTLGNRISEARKTKGLTQEELSELAKVNLRTIQRIENNENEPRNKTLQLICGILELDYNDLINNTEKGILYRNYSVSMFNGIFLVVFNAGFMGLFGYLTLDSNANLNSRLGGILLSIFLPFFIVWVTPRMTGIERMFKFGSGLIIYIILITVKLGFPTGFVTGLFICLILALAVLYYGNAIIEMKK